jgi:hypothetical protein
MYTDDGDGDEDEALQSMMIGRKYLHIDNDENENEQHSLRIGTGWRTPRGHASTKPPRPARCPRSSISTILQ